MMQQVEMYLTANQKFFPAEKMMYLRERLMALDENQITYLTSVELKDPTLMLIVSLFAGTLGIDRFLMGDTGMGVLKLLTGGCCGVLTIIDWFMIMNKTKEKNFDELMNILNSNAPNTYQQQM